MQEFCDAIIDGDEPQDGSIVHFYWCGPTTPVGGLPDLPEKWAAFLGENLVIGQIVELMEEGRVKLDLGSNDGIQKGSILAVQGREDIEPRRVKVLSTQERSCIAVEPLWDPSDKLLVVGRNVVMPIKIGRASTSPSAQLRRYIQSLDP